jgi:hypothetical protein
MAANIQPITNFYSTYINSQIKDFSRLGVRIARALGHPLVQIDAHIEQIYENIAISTEMFSKYAGYEEVLLTFDSNLYVPGQGIKMDALISITPFLTAPTEQIPGALTNAYAIGQQVVGDEAEIFPPVFEVSLSGSDNVFAVPPGWEDLIGDWRKVLDVWSFEEGSTSGINTLFTIEQSLAQQTYFSYSMGNYGFDLISWYVLKNWLETREKILSVKKDFLFNEMTQNLLIIPEPYAGLRFFGVVGCYIEKPLRHIIKEMWVYQYALALTKITIGRVRGKFTGVQLFAGGSLNTDLLSEGLKEKERLEEELLSGTPGFGDAAPPRFFVG